MKQARSWLLVTAFALLGSTASAQTPPPAPSPAPPSGAVAGEAKAGESVETPAGETDICQITPDAPQCKKGPTGPVEKITEVRAQISAVQQVYVKRKGRLEVQPYFGFTLNDQFVSHPSPGLALNYYITQVLAVGINGNLYAGLNSDSDFNFQNRRAARVAVPLNEYQWGANANFTYVPIYGKYAGFRKFIFHYDAYIVGGVGAISTRPIAVIDPDNRKFSFAPKLDFNVGLGLRIFFNRWLAANLEVRDYIYQEQLESLKVAPSGSTGCKGCASDPATWEGDKAFTNNLQAQVGVSVFIPFSWKYEKTK